MEKLIPQTIQEIDPRIPDALRLAFGIRYRASPREAPGRQDEVSAFAAAMLLPCVVGDPMECDYDYDVNKAAQVNLRMVSQSCYLPDHAEDAHFIHAGAGVVGVADGVGGYRSMGVDASAFARSLMRNAFQEVSAAAAAYAPGVCPRKLLERAHRKAVASHTPAASTAVILSLATGGTLRWAYVGDSGFAVFRDGRLLLRSPAQQHYFSCPFQLSADVSDGGTQVSSHAAVGEVTVMDGDVVVAGTDGLFDNVSDDELVRIVEMGTAMGMSPKNLADLIAGFAYEASRCSYRDTPFSVLSRRETGLTSTGGKPDDITVVVAFIVQEPDVLLNSAY